MQRGTQCFPSAFCWQLFFFCKVNLSEVRILMKLLNTYAEGSGQEINMTKSEVFFSNNLSNPDIEDLADIIGVHHI